MTKCNVNVNTSLKLKALPDDVALKRHGVLSVRESRSMCLTEQRSNRSTLWPLKVKQTWQQGLRD